MQSSSLILAYSVVVNEKTINGEIDPSNEHGVWNKKIAIKMGESRRKLDLELFRQNVFLVISKIKKGFLGFGEKQVIIGRGEISLADIITDNRIEGKAKITGQNGEKSFEIEVKINKIKMKKTCFPFLFCIKNSMAYTFANP